MKSSQLIPFNAQIALLGSHLSISGGHSNALDTAGLLGIQTLALFTASPRVWKRPKLENIDSKRFKQLKIKHNIQHVIAHALYLANPASCDVRANEKTIHALSAELQICHKLEIPWLVIHPGSHQGKGEDYGIRQAASILDQSLEAAGTVITGFALENTAGSGFTLGGRLEHLRDIISESRYPHRYGICLDTCHAFGAGYDFRDTESWQKFRENFDDILGFNHLKILHLNDSLGELGSLKDRHTHIGKGKIGRDGFALLMTDPICATVPKILETPKDKNHKWDKINLNILNHLLEKAYETL